MKIVDEKIKEVLFARMTLDSLYEEKKRLQSRIERAQIIYIEEKNGLSEVQEKFNISENYIDKKIKELKE